MNTIRKIVYMSVSIPARVTILFEDAGGHMLLPDKLAYQVGS